MNLFAGAHFVWNPFGNEMLVNGVPIHDAGAPRLAETERSAAPFSPVWVIGWFGYLNWVLMVANMIPALPFDMGGWFEPGRAVRRLSRRETASSPRIWLTAFALVIAIVGRGAAGEGRSRTG